MSKNGLILLTPTSVDKTGGSSTATISANGSVSFGLCETLRLNGVFSADYDNYMLVMRFTGSSGNDINIRFSSGGVDNSTASSYRAQYLLASSTTVSGYRTNAGTVGLWGYNRSTSGSGQVSWFYGPYLAQPTAYRSVSAYDDSGADMVDVAGTHNQSASYDGIWFDPNGFTLSGRVAVYGMRK